MLTLDFFSKDYQTVVQPENNFRLKNFAVVIEKNDDGTFTPWFWNLQTCEGTKTKNGFDYETALNIATVLHDALEYAD